MVPDKWGTRVNARNRIGWTNAGGERRKYKWVCQTRQTANDKANANAAGTIQPGQGRGVAACC